ncbi:GNAT family N-acetyltransferase [Phytomonospora endophytica]|uniref:GNAT superfamily N-acetyltransferase n=1 Tax=Phytomonospora endophytica TaxID=714109 RepID=A0A841G6U5_9ACTN|nr:GNAT family N-acetyltransferase [Phytomonospora endophytica]MBB6039790.1 GNAT superfamily N-acetyltransferase [Phytomonospora endophytica]GIG70356.1 GNAT family N-acetyltransferase [Phytomonospora endophytica]
MEFQPFTKHDLDALADFHALALVNHEPYTGPPPTWERLRSGFGESRPGTSQRNWLARVDGEAVGHVSLMLGTTENLHLAMPWIQVHRDHRRKGIGTKLHEFFVERAEEEGRDTFIANANEALPESTEPIDGAPSAFLRRMGYTPAMTSLHSRLDMAAVPEGAHDELAAKAWRHAEGYELTTWVEGVDGGDCPEHLLEDLAYLEYRLTTDMPLGDMDYEPERPDAERVRERARSALASGQTFCNAAAVHTATGKAVAWTFLGLSRDSGEHAFQAITVVDPDHRGHRLGTLVKLANLAPARELRPALRYVDTDNAEDNAPMIAVNTAIGYRPAHASVTYQRKI